MAGLNTNIADRYRTISTTAMYTNRRSRDEDVVTPVIYETRVIVLLLPVGSHAWADAGGFSGVLLASSTPQL